MWLKNLNLVYKNRDVSADTVRVSVNLLFEEAAYDRSHFLRSTVALLATGDMQKTKSCRGPKGSSSIERHSYGAYGIGLGGGGERREGTRNGKMVKENNAGDDTQKLPNGTRKSVLSRYVSVLILKSNSCTYVAERARARVPPSTPTRRSFIIIIKASRANNDCDGRESRVYTCTTTTMVISNESFRGWRTPYC